MRIFEFFFCSCYWDTNSNVYFFLIVNFFLFMVIIELIQTKKGELIENFKEVTNIKIFFFFSMMMMLFW